MALRVGEEQTRGRGVGCGGPVLGHGLHEHFPTERKERGLFHVLARAREVTEQLKCGAEDGDTGDREESSA